MDANSDDFRFGRAGVVDLLFRGGTNVWEMYRHLYMSNQSLYDVGNANSQWADGSMVVAGTTNSILDIRKEDAGTGNLRFLNGATEEWRIWLDNAETRLGFSADGGGTNVMALESGNLHLYDGTLYVDSGSTNTVASLESSDGDAIINILDSATDTSYPSRILVQGDDIYFMAGGSANHSKGIMIDDNGFIRLKGHTALGNNYLYDIGHANSEWINTGIKIASATICFKEDSNIPITKDAAIAVNKLINSQLNLDFIV